MTTTISEATLDTTPETNLNLKANIPEDKKKRLLWILDSESFKKEIAAADKAVDERERVNKIPEAVEKQEADAIKYFEEKNEPKNLKVVEHVKKLRAKRKITYKDLWEGKYEVTMPFGNKTLVMQFPPDMKLANTNYNRSNWDGDFKDKAISRSKLWSKEWQAYLQEKENQWQKLLSEAEFKTLIWWLYLEGEEQEQILAFMIATWFYGKLLLSDRSWTNYQLTVQCPCVWSCRTFIYLSGTSHQCSLVYSTFIE